MSRRWDTETAGSRPARAGTRRGQDTETAVSQLARGRRRGQALDIMNFLLFIAALVIWTQMFISPAAFNQAVNVQVNDYDPLIKTNTLTYYLEDGYVNQSLNDSVYRGLHAFGRSVGRWSPSDVATRGDIEEAYTGAVSEVFVQEYLGSLTGGGGCAVAGIGGVRVRPDSEEEATMTFTVEPNGEPRVECVSLRQIAADDRRVRSVRSIEFLDLPDRFNTSHLRYLKMHELARTVATSRDFREMIERTVTRASNIAWAEASTDTRDCDPYAESGQTCPYLASRFAPYATLSNVQEALENEQEQRVISDADLRGKLQNTAESAVSAHVSGDPAYDGMQVTIEVEEMEYRTLDPTVVQEDWRIAGCEQSCYRQNCEGPKSCSACGCSVSCDPEPPEPCPPTVCSTSDYTTTPPSRGGSLWTDDPWGLSTAERGSPPGEPRGIGEIPWDDDSLRFTRAAAGSSTRPLDVSWRGVPEPRFVQAPPGGGGDGTGEEEECEGDSCSRSCIDTSANNRVRQVTRRAWEFGEIQSFTRVTINVTDTTNRIPTRDGFVHPQFVVRYDQISTMTFS